MGLICIRFRNQIAFSIYVFPGRNADKKIRLIETKQMKAMISLRMFT